MYSDSTILIDVIITIWSSPIWSARAVCDEFCCSAIVSALRYNHITPLRTQLHWLKALEMIEFKVAVLVYRCLHQTTPPYLTEKSTSRLMSKPVSVSTPLHHHCLLSNAPVFQPSPIKLFQLLLSDCGTIFRRISCWWYNIRNVYRHFLKNSHWWHWLFFRKCLYTFLILFLPRCPLVPMQWLFHSFRTLIDLFTYLHTVIVSCNVHRISGAFCC